MLGYDAECDQQASIVSSTVEPLNNVTFGTSYSVHYREVPFFGVYKCVSTIGKLLFGAPNLVLYSGFPLFGVSFNGGSTVYMMTYLYTHIQYKNHWYYQARQLPPPSVSMSASLSVLQQNGLVPPPHLVVGRHSRPVHKGAEEL